MNASINLGRRSFVSIVILAMILLGLGYWPIPRQSMRTPLTTEVLPSLDPSPSASLIQQIELKWPRFIRSGDVETITLVVKPVDPAAGLPHLLSSLVEVRLEMPGFWTQPHGGLTQPLLAEELTFQWQVRALSAVFPQSGTVWVYGLAAEQNNALNRELLFAPQVELNVFLFPGLRWDWVRGLGWGLLFIGIVVRIFFNPR